LPTLFVDEIFEELIKRARELVIFDESVMMVIRNEDVARIAGNVNNLEKKLNYFIFQSVNAIIKGIIGSLL
jgi:hypothetical protein